MARKQIDLQFPNGVGRRLGLRATTKIRGAGYPAPYAYNVRLEDSLTNRLRGGSFVGNYNSKPPKGATLLVDDDGNHLVTDDGQYLTVEDAPRTIYRDRDITFSGNAVTASRVGNYGDTSLAADISDKLRPMKLQGAEGGEISDDVVAVAPHKDVFLLTFTGIETWVTLGDPTTGTMRRISDEVGIIGPNAWCTAHDMVYFLSSQGLYSVSANGESLKAVSEDKIPEDLTGVSDSACRLTYDHATRGVSIHKTTAPSWFYDTERDGFWPFDTTTTNSHVLIGPVKLGGPDMLGLIQTMHGIMAQGSATVTWHIVPGDTAEEAAANGKLAITAALAGNDYSSYTRASGSWSAGISQTARPRVTAAYAVLWLSSSGTWAYEGVSLSVVPAGRWRA